MIKKIVAVVISLILVSSMIGYAMGRVPAVAFWGLLLISFAIMHFFYPLNEKKKRRILK